LGLNESNRINICNVLLKLEAPGIPVYIFRATIDILDWYEESIGGWNLLGYTVNVPSANEYLSTRDTYHTALWMEDILERLNGLFICFNDPELWNDYGSIRNVKVDIRSCHLFSCLSTNGVVSITG
jgi:hypothetical protein